MVGKGLGATLLLLPLATVSVASQVSYTDPATNEVTSTAPLGVDGRFSYRVQTAEPTPYILPTQSVKVEDSSGQMAVGCYPMGDGQTVAMTSEMVVAAAVEITVTAMAFSGLECQGVGSLVSNPIVVEFTPESPMLLEP